MKEENQSSVSAGQQRRLDRKSEIQRSKKAAKRNKIIGICAACVVGIAIVGSIVNAAYTSAVKVKPASDFSALLNEDGTITNVTASELVTLPEYKGISIPSSVTRFSEEAIEAEVQANMEDYAVLVTDTDAKIQDGDKVNIDYVGKIDGVEFEGGNSNGEGSDLTIGSATFIDDFEQQLIGYGVGESVTVAVTFPEDYSNAEYAGKDATFDVVINGIYSTELTDVIVQENFSDYATTADEYRAYIKQKNIDEQFETYIDDYLTQNSTVSSYPKKYVEHIKSLKKYGVENEYDYMSQLYASFGYAGPTSLEEYLKNTYGKTEAEYDKDLAVTAKEDAKDTLIYQAILETEGLTVGDEYYDEDKLSSEIEQYGKGSVMQGLIKTRIIDFIKDSAIIL